MKKQGFDVIRKHNSWAPSKLGCYEECPAKASYKYLHKLPDPGGPALVRGSFIHEQCEHFVANRIKVLATIFQGEEVVWHPATVAKLKALRATYKKGKVRTELDAAFTAAWKPCEWMARDVWVRLKLDLVEIGVEVRAGPGGILDDGVRKVNKKCVHITDWKTGRYKPDGEYDDQLRCYCVAMLTSMPEMELATASLWFTDVGKEVTRENGVLTRAELEAEQKRWTKKVQPMFTDTVHAPTPNPTCRYCPYSVQKNGICKF